jgi:hypothetical protein
VVRGCLRGRTPLHRALRENDVAGSLLRELREDAHGLTPFFWWETVEIATKPEIDRDAIRARPDFPAELVKRCDGLRARGELDAIFAQLQRGLPPKISRHVDGGEIADVATLLDDAEYLALDLLEGRV